MSQSETEIRIARNQLKAIVAAAAQIAEAERLESERVAGTKFTVEKARKGLRKAILGLARLVAAKQPKQHLYDIAKPSFYEWESASGIVRNLKNVRINL